MNAKIAEKMNNIKPSGIRQLFDLAQGLSGVISLGIGEPDFDVPEHIKQAAIDAINHEKIKYTPNSGIAELREAICDKFFQDYNVNFDPHKEVMITVGGSEGLASAFIGHLNPGDEVVITDPSFLSYEPMIRVAGGQIRYLPLFEDEKFHIRADILNEVITPKTRIVTLNYPCNPTGATYDRHDLKGIAEVAEDNNLIVLSDEVYDKLVFDGKKHVSMAELSPNAIVINSFSKSYAMTGWRVGSVLAHKELINPMLRVHQFHIASLPVPGQYAALAALYGSQDCVEHMRSQYEKRRDCLMKELKKLSSITCVTPEGAFYAFPNVSATGMDGNEFSEKILKEAMVTMVPGSAFGEKGKDFVRISFATSTELIIEACERIQDVLG